MYNLIENNIVVNLIIGFFYSAIIGLAILFLTYFLDKSKSLKNLLVDLTKLTLILRTIKEPIDRISKLDGAEYRKYFASVLDGKEITLEEIKTVDEFIIYDEIPYLPKINDYLVDEFNNSVKSIKNENIDLKELAKETQEEKKKYLLKNNAFILSYEGINRRLLRLNQRLSYYRSMTFELYRINISDLTIENASTKNKLKAFKFCIDSIIKEAKALKESLELLESTVSINRKILVKDINKNKNILSYISKILGFVIIVCLILLIIA